MEEFLKLAKEVHEDRLRDERKEFYDIQKQSQIIYSLFKIWCIVNDKDDTEYKYFTEFVKSRDEDFNFWFKKAVLENYFGLKIEFDYNTKKWITTKKEK